MKILFFTRKFAPQNYIGAIRPTKLAKYLTRLFSHEVDVICMQDNSNIKDKLIEKDITEISHIDILPYCKWCEYIKTQYNQQVSKIKTNQINNKPTLTKSTVILKIKDVIYLSIRNVLYLISIYDSYIYGKRTIKNLQQNKKFKEYKAFFSTTSLIESYIVGKWLKKHNPQIKWIYDLRDPIRIDAYPFISKKIMKNILKKIIPLVDEVTGVSEACVAKFKEFSHPSITVIPNGFDYEDIECFESKANIKTLNERNLIIVYTGALYDGKRDITPLLLLLAELSQSFNIDLSRIEIHYAGKDFNILKENQKNTKVNINLINHGFITRKEALTLQRSADILLLMSWNSKNDTGVVTGKFYEYLMMSKPICCLIKGDLPYSTLRKLIQESDAGMCYEEADQTTREPMKEFLMEHYHRKIFHQANKKNYPLVNSPKIQRFNYSNIALQINNLLCKK